MQACQNLFPPLFIRISKLHLLHCICMPPYGCRTCVRRRRQSVKPSPLPPVKPKLIPNRPRRSRSYSSSMTDNKQADTAANSKLSSLSYSFSFASSFLVVISRPKDLLCYVQCSSDHRFVRSHSSVCSWCVARFGESKFSNSDLRIYILVVVGFRFSRYFYTNFTNW